MQYIARVFMPILLIVYIGYETYLKINHESLCNATGCKMAGELLRFPSLYLNYMGIVAVTMILITGILSVRKRELDIVYFAVLYASIAFESIMIGYQILVNPEPCIFCLGVYGSLILIALFSSPKLFVYAVPGIVAIFIALSSLAIPKNMPLVTSDGIYLIHSPNCPHCKRVKVYFKAHNIKYNPIKISSTNARSIAKSFDIDEIPIAIIKQNGVSTLLHGDKSIINYFKSLESDDKKPVKIDSSNVETEKKGGCSVNSVIEESGGCQESNPLLEGL